jgi:CubicO group peptidase (beta-lactamase class C family)
LTSTAPPTIICVVQASQSNVGCVSSHGSQGRGPYCGTNGIRSELRCRDVHCQASTQLAIERYGIVFWPPGDHFDYSNLGYGVLGQIISDVSGQSLSQVFEREIFRPLQMRNCYLSMTGDIHPGSGVNYDDFSGRQNPLRVSDTPAASSVRCSAHDLAIFGSFVLNTPVRGQKRVLSNAQLHELLDSDEASAGEHYSFGWERNTVGGHTGVFAQGGTRDSFALI